MKQSNSGSMEGSDMLQNEHNAARMKYAPSSVNLLFLAEAPPLARERYFYYSEVGDFDLLWSALMKALYPREFGDTRKERQRKHDWLTRFQRDGNMLIDALKAPIPKGMSNREKLSLLRRQQDALSLEIRGIRPGQILLIKATVYDALYEPLRGKGLPVINGRLPFPGSGRQKEFLDKFARLVNQRQLILQHQPG